MNIVSRTLSGIAAIIIGLFVLIGTQLGEVFHWSLLWGMIWGIVIMGVGIALLLNKNEDEIEEINEEDKK